MFEGFEAYQESDCAGRKSCGLGVRAVLRPSGGQGNGHPAEFPTVARIRSRSGAGLRESLSAEWGRCFCGTEIVQVMQKGKMKRVEFLQGGRKKR